ncbi:MAG: hypothetical protein K6347_08365 [Campylobacterales bacterium]
MSVLTTLREEAIEAKNTTLASQLANVGSISPLGSLRTAPQYYALSQQVVKAVKAVKGANKNIPNPMQLIASALSVSNLASAKNISSDLNTTQITNKYQSLNSVASSIQAMVGSTAVRSLASVVEAVAKSGISDANLSRVVLATVERSQDANLTSMVNNMVTEAQQNYGANNIDINMADINETTDLVDKNTSEAINAIKQFARIPKLYLTSGTVTVGSQSYTTTNPIFAISGRTDQNVMDMTISFGLNRALVTNDQDDINATLTVRVKEKNSDRSFDLSISNVQIITKDNAIEVRLTKESLVTLKALNMPSLVTAMGGYEISKNLTSDLTLSDTSFNVSTILNALDYNSTRKAAIRDALLSYAKYNNSYYVLAGFDIGGKVDTNLVDINLGQGYKGSYKGISGTVTLSGGMTPHLTQNDNNDRNTTGGVTDNYSNYVQAVGLGEGQLIEEEIKEYTVKLFTNYTGSSLASSQTGPSPFVKLCDSSNQSQCEEKQLFINGNYPVGTKFVVKVYKDGVLVKVSNEVVASKIGSDLELLEDFTIEI